MARKAKFVKCPVCRNIGRIKRGSTTIRFSYPQEAVVVPNVSRLDTVSEAWDYASKVCLYMSQQVLKKPPYDTQSDNEISYEVLYWHFRTFIPHSQKDITSFESRHRTRIEERLQEHASNHNAVVSRMSLSLLYGAIACSALSDLFSYSAWIPKEINEQKEMANMIHTRFSGLLIDPRAKTTLWGWFQIQDYAQDFGPNAAAKKYADEITGGTLSRKQIKAKAHEIKRTLQDIDKYDIKYRTIFSKFGDWVREDPDRSALVVQLFDMNQFDVYDQERKYEYACVVHKKSPTSLYNNSENSNYFREGKKTSLYSNNSKSEMCPISPSEPLTYVDIKENN